MAQPRGLVSPNGDTGPFLVVYDTEGKETDMFQDSLGTVFMQGSDGKTVRVADAADFVQPQGQKDTVFITHNQLHQVQNVGVFSQQPAPLLDNEEDLWNAALNDDEKALLKEHVSRVEALQSNPDNPKAGNVQPAEALGLPRRVLEAQIQAQLLGDALKGNQANAERDAKLEEEQSEQAQAQENKVENTLTEQANLQEAENASEDNEKPAPRARNRKNNDGGNE